MGVLLNWPLATGEGAEMVVVIQDAMLVNHFGAQIGHSLTRTIVVIAYVLLNM
jgi:hypothetical protein